MHIYYLVLHCPMANAIIPRRNALVPKRRTTLTFCPAAWRRIAAHCRRNKISTSSWLEETACRRLDSLEKAAKRSRKG